MKKILIIAIFMVSGALNAQITLTGTVKDTIGSPLEMANVIALDTVTKKITSYGFTDAQGKYKLDLQKNTVYNIKISYVGLKSIDDTFKTGDTDMVKNYILQDDNMLDEIQIVAKMPVTVKGDTIIYNADSFKNGTERKLEDVLKKLPGVEINDDGQIEVEGKRVEKVMVDGKDFFDGDSKLATKNIPSNAVDKIQVLRNFGDVNQLRGVQDNQDRVALNIKLKKGKENFWFGDVTVGGGDSPNEGLYLFQPKLFYYTPNYTLNVIGDINNIGDVVLSRRDVRNFSGGFQSQSPSNGTNINIADGGIGFLTANARNSNRIETKLGALNFSYSPSKKVDLSGFLIWSGNSNGRRNISNIDFIDDDIPDDVEDNITDQTSNTALAKFSMIYKKDINNQMNYDVIGRFSNEFRNNTISSFVVGNNILEAESATPFRINQNLSYFYTASEKSIFALEVQHLLQDEDPFYVASLENNTGADGFDEPADDLGLDLNQSFYRLNQNRRVQSNQLDAKLDYYYILNDKSNLNFVGGTILSRQNFDSRFFQVLDNGTTFDPTLDEVPIPNARLDNDTEYNFTDLYAGLRYRVRSGIFTMRPGFTLHSYNVNNTQFDTEYFEDKFLKFLPEIQIIAQFKRSESLTFEYRQRVNFTDVNQIARGIIANNYPSFFFGNDELQNAFTENVSLFYRSFNLFNNTTAIARVSYTKTIDQIVNAANFVPGSVISTSTSLNLPFDGENFTAFGLLGKTWGKWRARLSANYTYSKNFQLFRGATTENNNNIYTFTPSLNTNFRKAPNFTLRYRVTFRDNENTNLTTNNITDFSTVNHAPSIEFDAYVWNSLTVRSDFTFNEVKQDGVVQNRFKIWNFSLGYRKDRDAKWEYEIRADNILGTDSQVNIGQDNIANRINEQFILPRFITARVIYSL
jgi:hypothetical protein